LKVAKHGPGESVYLIDFEYHADSTRRKRPIARSNQRC
jgi:hypothetical protein